MLSRFTAAFSLLLGLTMAGSPALQAQDLDAHALYERSCARCHAPHAGDFVPQSLVRRGDRIVGRENGKELRAFLAAGHGRLAPDEVDAMVAHLAFILKSGGLFRDKCLICHDRAVVLARRELILRDGRLVGRYSGRDIAGFLETHGRLDGAEVTAILRMLERQLAPPGAE
jgi:hypothetical protein